MATINNDIDSKIIPDYSCKLEDVQKGYLCHDCSRIIGEIKDDMAVQFFEPNPINIQEGEHFLLCKQCLYTRRPELNPKGMSWWESLAAQALNLIGW